jgi:3-hydroxypropionyl-CoA synthetase (ADP-forming)
MKKNCKWEFNFDLLKKYNIPVLDYGFAYNLDQAKKLAAKIGYPVALKIFSEKFLHKSEHHALALNLKDEKGLILEFNRLKSLQKNAPICVQKYVPAKLELIVGGKYDEQFGPTILLGFGGIYTNIFADVQVRVCPINLSEARSMISSLKSFEILKGYRNQQGINLSKLSNLLVNVSNLLCNEEILQLDLNPIIQTADNLFVADVRMLLCKREKKFEAFNIFKKPKLRKQVKNLKYIFDPKSVAIIGASKNPKKIGYTILKNFVDGFKGKVFPINLHEEEILGLKCYKKVSDINQKVDCAIIAVPAQSVYSVLKDVAKAKIPSAIVISGGFSEIGNKNEELKIKKLANKHQIALIGPNCMGSCNFEKNVDSVFLPKEKLHRPKTGDITILSQSGAIGGCLLDLASYLNIPIGKFVSYGNALCINESDLLNYFLEDEKTNVLAIYLEGLKDGRKFLQSLYSLSCKKPVIVLKGAKTSFGSSAALSHTASLAGSSVVFSSALKQAGALEANDIDEFFDFARLLSFEQKNSNNGGQKDLDPKHSSKKIFRNLFFGNNVAILTNGGGNGVLAADALEQNHFSLAKFSNSTLNQLKKVFLPPITISNPLDILGDADAQRYEKALKILAKDENIDIIVCIILFQTPTLDANEILKVLIEAKNYIKKPFIVVSTGGEYTKEQQKILNENYIPVFSTPFTAIKALAMARNYNLFCRLKL